LIGLPEEWTAEQDSLPTALQDWSKVIEILRYAYRLATYQIVVLLLERTVSSGPSEVTLDSPLPLRTSVICGSAMINLSHALPGRVFSARAIFFGARLRRNNPAAPTVGE
jgi:hypothetical protein